MSRIALLGWNNTCWIIKIPIECRRESEKNHKQNVAVAGSTNNKEENMERRRCRQITWIALSVFRVFRIVVIVRSVTDSTNASMCFFIVFMIDTQSSQCFVCISLSATCIFIVLRFGWGGEPFISTSTWKHKQGIFVGLLCACGFMNFLNFSVIEGILIAKFVVCSWCTIEIA